MRDRPISLADSAVETKIVRRHCLSILPPLDFDWQAEIDQSCLEERQRKHAHVAESDRSGEGGAGRV